jgi:hypothetical protein
MAADPTEVCLVGLPESKANQGNYTLFTIMTNKGFHSLILISIILLLSFLTTLIYTAWSPNNKIAANLKFKVNSYIPFL